MSKVARSSARSRKASSSSRQSPARTTRTTKISVSVEGSVLRDVRRIVRHKGTTLSAYITDTLARDLRRRRLQELLAEYEADAGTITEEELERARAEWLG